MNYDTWSEGLEKLREAEETLSGLLYPGDDLPARLRDDLPVDVVMDLVGVMHDLNFAEGRISLLAPERVR